MGRRAFLKAIFEGCHVAGKLFPTLREHARIYSATLHESAVNECKKIIDGFTHENDHTLKGYFSKALYLVEYMRFRSKTEWCEHKPKTPQVIMEVNETAPTRVTAKVLTSNIGV